MVVGFNHSYPYPSIPYPPFQVYPSLWEVPFLGWMTPEGKGRGTVGYWEYRVYLEACNTKHHLLLYLPIPVHPLP